MNLKQLKKEISKIKIRWEDKDRVREKLLVLGRKVIRLSGKAIKFIHNGNLTKAGELIEEAKSLNLAARKLSREYSDLYYNYTKNAQKELVEAVALISILTDRNIPTRDELKVECTAYANGLGEVIGELRRYVLNCLNEGQSEKAQQIFDLMQEIFNILTTLNVFPSKINGGFRRTIDVARNLIVKTKEYF